MQKANEMKVLTKIVVKTKMDRIRREWDERKLMFRDQLKSRSRFKRA